MRFALLGPVWRGHARHGKERRGKVGAAGTVAIGWECSGVAVMEWRCQVGIGRERYGMAGKAEQVKVWIIGAGPVWQIMVSRGK